jgi:hypothetical protein
MCDAKLHAGSPKYDLGILELLEIIKSPFKGFTSIGCLKCQKFANIMRCAVFICPECGSYYFIKRSSFELWAYPDYGPKREQLVRLMLDNVDNELDPFIRLSKVAKLVSMPLDYALKFSQGEINHYLRGHFRLKTIENNSHDILIHKDDVRSFYERIRSHKITSQIRINI